MAVIAPLVGLEIEEHSVSAMETQDCGGKERPLEAVGLLGFEHHARRTKRVAILLEIPRQAVEEVLDFYRSIELCE
jgi:hypothetical protein